MNSARKLTLEIGGNRHVLTQRGALHEQLRLAHRGELERIITSANARMSPPWAMALSQ